MPRKHFVQHWIKPNDSNASPKKIIAFDCESDRTKVVGKPHAAEHRFRLAVARSAVIEKLQPTRQQCELFHTGKALWQWMYSQLSPQYTTWIIAHGMFYDFRVSAASIEFERGNLTLDAIRSERSIPDCSGKRPKMQGILSFDGLPFIISCRHVASGSRVVIVDLLNWFRSPLRELGDMLGTPKLEMPKQGESIARWIEYCTRDVDILFDMFVKLIGWVSKNRMGMFRYTAAAQAMSCFRHGRMPTRIFPTLCPHKKAIEREAYFGGRIECFRLGHINQRVHLVDVNSMYPAVMRDSLYPCKMVHYEPRSEFGTIPVNFAAANSVARCRIQTDRPIYPVRTDAGICYPSGRFETTLCGRELSAAIARGHCTTIGRYAVYDCSRLFHTFVNDLWRLRCKHAAAGERPLEQFAKLLLNSLHGKFAQWQPKWQEADDGEYCPDFTFKTVHNKDGGVLSEYFGFAGYTFKKQGKVEKPHTMPIISAFISGDARMKMNYLREVAGTVNTLYQGVDSLLVTDDGLARLAACKLMRPNEMGYLKLKSSQEQAFVFGCSRYELGNELVMSGLPSLNTRIADDAWNVTRFGEFRDLFRGKPADYVIERVGLYSADVEYVKRRETESGWTEALELAEF